MRNTVRTAGQDLVPCFRLSFYAMFCLLMAFSLPSCSREKPMAKVDKGTQTNRISEHVEGQVKAFCGDCHEVPSPDSFPRNAWSREVDRGFEFYNLSGRNDLNVPLKSEVIRWYRSRAPSELTIATTKSTEGALIFQAETFGIEDSIAETGIAGLQFVEGEHGPEIFALDMLNGAVSRLSRNSGEWRTETLSSAGNPCRIERTDLDQDDSADYVIADLGSAQPEDHDRGRVLWLCESEGKFKVTEIATGLGRVADVRPADFDADGDLDLIVAEFGWLKTGRILLLENKGNLDGDEFTAEVSNWRLHVLDNRHGTIHVPVLDLDGDGRMDFVALVSQEYEAVDAFINQGGLKFRKIRIWSAPDPSYGSSGIEMVDLDLDGDFDVLYSNGDTLDSFYVKPYHGVRWFENEGRFPFTPHELVRMPGVSRALPADLDADGDLDVVACGMIPWSRIQDAPAKIPDSLAWLENDGECNFLPHPIERSRLGHLALIVGDVDVDGDVDIVSGSFGKPEDVSEVSSAISVWWNRSEIDQ